MVRSLQGLEKINLTGPEKTNGVESLRNKFLRFLFFFLILSFELSRFKTQLKSGQVIVLPFFPSHVPYRQRTRVD